VTSRQRDYGVVYFCNTVFVKNGPKLYDFRNSFKELSCVIFLPVVFFVRMDG
jgi:hypothetical protein